MDLTTKLRKSEKEFDFQTLFYILCGQFTVPVVQLVRTPDCDSGGRGFEPLRAPHVLKVT